MAPASGKCSIYVIYYSMYGHIRALAQAMKEGIDSVPGVEGVLFQVPETLPEDVLAKMHAPPKSADPIANVQTLPEADGFAFGCGTRFGGLAAQFKTFWDATGAHWKSGALQGKPFTMFTATATAGGGMETTIMGGLSNMVHQGMIYVPPGFLTPELQFNMNDVHGGSAWGAGTLTGPDGSRTVLPAELAFAKASGAKLAKVALKLKA